ncbi:MAG: flagellar motor switch protein FliN [Proteobacteria bacterium]|nr:flagellar motor switch protein FliN [Pseudomonadota bacterium]
MLDDDISQDEQSQESSPALDLEEIQENNVSVSEDKTKRAAPPTMKELEAVYEIPVQISAVLGRASMPVNQLLKLGRGAVVELDRRVGEAIDIYVNNRLIARGEVVVVEDRLGITMTEIIKS